MRLQRAELERVKDENRALKRMLSAADQRAEKWRAEVDQGAVAEVTDRDLCHVRNPTTSPAPPPRTLAAYRAR